MREVIFESLKHYITSVQTTASSDKKKMGKEWLRKRYKVFEKGKGIGGKFIKIHENLGRRQKAINKSTVPEPARFGACR